MLVVAPKAFHDALGGYLIHREKSRPVELAALEEVLDHSEGRDDAEKLKRALFVAWRDRGVRYVLLVGDGDVLPIRYMMLDRVTGEAFDTAFYPSDLYYADVARRDGTFDDWNGRQDGHHGNYFGEVFGEKHEDGAINQDLIDYRPEIAVGRWPVSTPQEVSRMVTKTIRYESGAESAAPWTRRGAFAVTGGWVDCRARFKGLASAFPENWDISLHLYSDEKAESAPAYGEAALVEKLQKGVGLVVHAGHGHDHGWEGSLSTGSIAKFHNRERLPIVISAGCSTARFSTLPPYESYTDILGAEHSGTNNKEVFLAPPPPPNCYQRGKYNPTGFGEQLLRAGDDGAVAYFGCNTGSQPCGLTLVEGFVTAIGAGRERTLGDCWIRAVEYYYEKEHLAELKPNADWYPPSIFFQGMKFMLFGDPALMLPQEK